MRLSVAIVTYGRAAICLHTVRLLMPLLSKDDELIIVEQGEDPLRRQLQPDTFDRVRFLFLAAPNMVRARNAAIESARGRLILFVDDDVIPSADLLQAHVNAYQDASVGGVAGRILGPRESDTHAVNTPPADWTAINFNMRCRTEVETARGCNMSFRRDLLLHLGGFDTAFRPPFFFREDSDVSFRIRAAGYKLLFEPSALLWHLEAKSGGARGCARPASPLRSELWMYRHHYCHYRDNLYFLCKHFHGTQRTRHLLQGYRAYVGLSRWPWRLVAKNACFAAALIDAALSTRRSRPPYFEPHTLAPVTLIPMTLPQACASAWQSLFARRPRKVESTTAAND